MTQEVNSNKLNRTITSKIYDSNTSYELIEAAWSDWVNHRDPVTKKLRSVDPVHLLLYQTLRGKDWRQSFNAPTNKIALENGAFCNWRLWWALLDFYNERKDTYLLEPFVSIGVTAFTLSSIRRFIPLYNFWNDREARRNPCDYPAYNQYKIQEILNAA